MNIKHDYLNRLLLAKEDVLDLKLEYNNLNFLIIPMLRDIEYAENLIIKMDISSNWDIIENIIKEIEVNIDNIDFLLKGNTKTVLSTFEEPITGSSKILYLLIHNTNLVMKEYKIPKITRMIRAF